MKNILLMLLFFLSQQGYGQNSKKGKLILEVSFAQVINKPGSGYNFGVYYKTKWPLAIRYGVTHIFTGDEDNRFRGGYLQAGYMNYRKRMEYYALVGFSPAIRYIFPVYSGGAGYLLSEKSKTKYYIFSQLNYAKNREGDFLWAHAGFHIRL